MADRSPSAGAGARGSSRATFVEGSTMRHVVVMTVTGSVGLMAIFAVDFLNLVYISMLGEAELAAAIGYAGTVLFFTMSLSIGLNISATALTARALGAGDRDLARRRAGSSLLFVTVVLSLVTIALMPFLGLALDFLGASGRTHDIAHRFLLMVVPSVPVLGVGMVFSGLLRACGDARRAMYVTLAGAMTTAILDPILIFGFHLGVDGAAITSVISRTVLFAIGYWGCVRLHRLVAMPRLAHLRADLGSILGIAVPAVATQLATPIGNAYVTATIAAFGDPAVAAWAIIGRLIPVAFGAIFALSGSIGPILGQNLGAGQYERLRRALLDSLIFASLYVVALSLVLWLAQDEIVYLFGARGESEAVVRFFCTWIAGTFLFWGALFVANAAFNNLGFPALATLFNWGRATLGTMPFVAVGAAWWGAEGVLIGQGIGAVLFGTAAVATCFRVIRHIGRPPDAGRTPALRWFAMPPFTSGKGGTAG